MNLHRLQTKLNQLHPSFLAKEVDDAVVLTGNCDDYSLIVQAGKLAVDKKRYRGVVNNIHLSDHPLTSVPAPTFYDQTLEGLCPDVIIIGGGIIGCSIARELSKWDLNVYVLDKSSDVGMHGSSRNDGMIHPGIDLTPKLKKGIYNRLGNELYSKVSSELQVPFERRGSYLVFNKSWMRIGMMLYLRYKSSINKIPMVRYVSQRELLKKEPEVGKQFKGAAYFPSTGYVSPYLMTIAYAENAIQNGVTFSLNTTVLGLSVSNHHMESVQTNRGTLFPKVVINAAGVFADVIAEMANDRFYTIHPRKGTIAILDKKSAGLTETSIGDPFHDPQRQNTKGGGVVRTVDNNILIGPDAVETPLREDYTTDQQQLDQLISKFTWVTPNLNRGSIITYFSGIRAATYEEDFIVEPSKRIENFIHVAGIQSPGITAAPAIALDVEQMALQILGSYQVINKNPSYNPYRKSIPDPRKMTSIEREQLIKNDPEFGVILCRCEQITKGEIRAAIRSPLPATTLDAVKRRVRAGMGRCQGSFCGPLVLAMLAEEQHVPLNRIEKSGKGSTILCAPTKGGESHEIHL